MGGGIYFRIGIMIVFAVALLVAMIWFLGGTEFNHGLAFESYFRESVQGLEVGAPVKYRGVTLGRVTDIGLVSAEYGQGQPIDIERQTYRLVFVRCIINPNKLGHVPTIEEAVKTGLRARLASQGITGLSYIELDFVNPADYPPQTVPWQPKVAYIPSVPSTLAQVQDAAQQLLATLNHIDLEKLTTQMTGLLVDLRAELSSGDVHKTLADASALLRATNDAIQAADLPGLTADIKRTSTSLRDTVQSEQTRKLLTNASLAAERLANAADKLTPLIASMQATVHRLGNGSADVEQSLIPILRDLQATTANLRDVSEALRHNPSQAILGAPPPRTLEPVK